MKSAIEELELLSAVYESTENHHKVNEFKRAISLLQKNMNVFWFPDVMNFKTIVRPPPMPNIPAAQPSINYPSPIPVPVLGAGTPVVSGVPASILSALPIFPGVCEPRVGEEIFGMFRYKNEYGEDRNGNCIYTWQEENNPKEILHWAVGVEYFSAGVKYMPCKKNKSDKFLVICTDECCKQ